MAIEEFIARKINPDGSTGTSKATIENHVVTYENSENPGPYITEIKTLNGVSLVGEGNYDFDTTLNEASTNAVQNKVIAKFANDVAGTYVTKIELYEALKRGEVSSEVEKVYTNEINYIAENVMPSGKVTKILGKTEKSENLLDVEHNYITVGNPTILVASGEVDISGTQARPTYRKDELPLQSGTYVLSFYVQKIIHQTAMFIGFVIKKQDDTNEYVSVNPTAVGFQSKVITIPSGAKSVQFRININDTDQILETPNEIKMIDIMLNSGDTVLPYSSYYNGLKHTHITGLKTTGINLWDEEWEVGGILSGTGQNYPLADRIRSKNYIDVLPSTNYYFKTSLWAYWYDINKNYLGTRYLVNNNTLVSPDNAYYVRFEENSAYGTTYNHDICINISDVAINGNYYPYEEETLNIEADLNGVGTASDEINVEEGKYYQRMNTLADLVSLNWTYDSTYERWWSDSISSLIKGSLNNNTAGNLIAESYDNVATNYLLGTAGNLIAVSDNGRVNVKNGSNTTKPSGKLVYELITPIVTDVELENDGWLSNLIKDGSITQLVDTTSLIAKEVDIAMNVVVDNQ